MSQEEIHRFAEAVKKDAGLMEEVKAKGSDMAGIAAMAKSKGYNFTAEEMSSLAEDKKGQLSDEDLDKVAGGDAVWTANFVVAVNVVVAG